MTRRSFLEKIATLTASWSWVDAFSNSLTSDAKGPTNEYSEAGYQVSAATKGVAIVNVTDRRFNGGAIGDGVKSDSKAFQEAMLYAHAIGGAKIIIPKPDVEWLLDFPVFILDNTEVAGTGKDCLIRYRNPTYSKGRGGFVIGSSLEANRERALAAYADNAFPGASTRNDEFVNPPLKKYLRDNPQYIQARNSSLHDVYIVADFESKDGSGGYGVNLVNAWNCHVYSIWGEGWTQLIGMGSDGPPETPSNHGCSAYNLHVIHADKRVTYYAIGFISNSTKCSIYNGFLESPLTPGTKHGSGVATNYVEDCQVKDIYIPSLGRTETSEGVLLQNAKGTLADRIFVGDAKTAIATFFKDPSFNDPASPNLLGPTIVGTRCDRVVRIGAKFAHILGYQNLDSQFDITFGNSDATGNIIEGMNQLVETRNGQNRSRYFEKNQVAGWSRKKVELYSSASSRKIGSEVVLNESSVASTRLESLANLMYEIPIGWRAINSIEIICDSQEAVRSEALDRIEVKLVKPNGLSDIKFLSLHGDGEDISVRRSSSKKYIISIDRYIELPLVHDSLRLSISLDSISNSVLVEGVAVNFFG